MAADAPHPEFDRYAGEATPSTAVGAPGKNGVLELTFRRSDRGSELVHDYATAPYHVSGTLNHDPHPDAATVYVQSSTGGVAQGDRLDETVTVERDAMAHVTTQGATKVQSMTHNYAGSEATLVVGSDGHLDYVPDPTILHAEARYHQTIDLTVAEDATAVVGDVVVPGRLARDERFEFERFVSRVRTAGPGGLLFEDATHLAPAESNPDAAGVLGSFSVYGSLFVVAPAADSNALNDRVHEAVIGCEPGSEHAGDDEVRLATTRLPNDAGVLVRVLGARAGPVRDGLRTAWSAARETLVGAPAPNRRKN